MERNFDIEIRAMIKREKRRKVWKKILSVMMCLVVFVTTYALILPAITMESATFCGIEEHTHEVACYNPETVCQIHLHTDACYGPESLLVCTESTEPGHIHTEECAPVEETNLTCGLEETEGHAHTELCAPVTETSVTCGLEEGEGHTHVAECSVTEQVLSCGMEESEEHTHADGCYSSITTNVCGLAEAPAHTHTEECYTTTVTYGCGLEEISAHAHTEECYTTTVTYGCGLEEKLAHVHEETCYERPLICTLEEDLTHQHTLECVGELVCELEVHTHSLQCYSNPNADLESAAIWERTLPDALTGDYAQDVLAVAVSQLGYTESSSNYMVEEGITKGYTRYGAWYGIPYGDWCAMFVSFCLDYAGVEDFPQDSNCPNWVNTLKERNLYAEAEGYVPNAGDLIFFDWGDDGRSDHVGLVAEYIVGEDGASAKVRTIEGNSGNCVAYNVYDENDAEIMGYGIVIDDQTRAEQATASDLMAEIDQLPSAEEFERVMTEYEEAGDLDGQDAYYIEISDQVCNTYFLYSQLTDYQQALVYNADKLMALEDIWGIVYAPEEPDTQIPGEDLPVSSDAIANIVTESTTEAATDSSYSKSNRMKADSASTFSLKTTRSTTINMDSMIDSVIVYHKENGAWVAIPNGGTITEGEDLKFTIDYTVPGNTLSDSQNTIIYNIPENISGVASSSGNVYNNSGEVVGTYTVDGTAKTLSITFNDTFIDHNELNKVIEGSISFYATVEKITTETEEEADISFSDKVTINMEIVEKEDVTGDVKVKKEIAKVDGANITYTITVTSETGTFSEVTLTDEMTGGLQYLEGLTVTDKNGKSVSYELDSSSTAEKFILTLPQMAAGDSYTITYVAMPVGETPSSELLNNKATVSSTNNYEIPINDFSEVDYTFNMVDKSGTLQEDGSIAWTIVINQDKRDISGWVLKDLMQDTDGTQEFYSGQVTIADSSGKVIATPNLPYTFPEGSNDTYTITYTTTHDTVAGANSVTNVAGLFFEGDTDYFVDYEWVGIGTSYPVTKEGQITKADETAGEFIIQWTITLDTSSGPLPAKSTIQDKLDTNQYMTHAQLMAAFANANAAITAAGLSIDWAWATAVVDGTTVNVGYDVVNAEGAENTYNYFTGFRIRLKEDVPQNTTLSFSFESTSDAAPELGYFRNRVNINGGAEYTARVEYSSGKPTISKHGTDPNDDYRTIPRDAEVDYNTLYEVDGQKTLWWRLRLTIPSAYTIPEPPYGEYNVMLKTPVVTIKETLPEGMELVGTIAQPGGNSSLRVTQTPDENGYAEFSWSGYYYIFMQVSTGEDGRQVVTYGLNHPLAEWIRAESSDPILDLYVVAKFKDDLDWGGDDDSIITQIPFTNTASVVNPDGGEFDVADHTFTVNYNKTEEVVSKFGALNQQNELEYSVVLNEKARDLDPDSSTLNATDVLTYVSPAEWPVKLYLKPNSVAVYDYTGGVKGNLITTAKYTYQETSTGTPDITYTHTLDLTIPDSQALLLEYVYIVDGIYNENYSYDMINTCTISGTISGSITDNTEIKVNVYDSQASANVTGIYIYKVDEDNNGLYLPGAVFNLYTWNTHTNEYIRVKHPNTDGTSESHYAFTTSADPQTYGYLILNGDTVENIAYNTAYYLVEVTPPTGYFRNPAPYYFYIQHSDTNQNPYNLPEGFSGDMLKDGALIYYENEAATTEISIRKKWQDHNENPITVTADQVESVSFELWQKLDGVENSDTLYGTYTVTPDANGFWEKTITGLPKGVPNPQDGTKGSLYQYYIKEVTVPGYTVSYENNDGITTGTITMTNRKLDGYELPETGGAGTQMYTMAGLLLMLTSAAFLVYIHKKRRREAP